MAVNFQLEGMEEHAVQSDVVFKIKLVDAEKNPADRPNLKIEAFLKGSHDQIRGTVTYGNCYYELKFFAGSVGTFELNVTVNGKVLYQGTDAVVRVVDKRSQHLSTFLFKCEGTGFVGGNIGQIMHITIKPTEKDGTKKTLSESQLKDLEVRVGSGPSAQKIHPHPVDEAAYLAEYKVDTPGFYEVDVIFEGKTVLKQAERPYFTAPASAKNSKAVQVPKGMVTVGQPANFSIQARNTNDLNIKSGGDVFIVKCDGPGELPDLTVRDQNNGQYLVSFTPLETGIYKFEITINDELIGNSPAQVAATRR